MHKNLRAKPMSRTTHASGAQESGCLGVPDGNGHVKAGRSTHPHEHAPLLVWHAAWAALGLWAGNGAEQKHLQRNQECSQLAM